MNRLNPFFRYTITGALLFLKSLLLYPFSKLARHRLSNAYHMLSYPFFGKTYVELSYLLKNEDLQVCLSPLKSREHNVDAFELLSICALIKDNLCNTIFEIGTYDGRTTRAMAMNLSDRASKIYTLNLPPDVLDVELETSNTDVGLSKKVVSGDRFIGTPEECKIVQLWGDSAVFDFFPYYKKMDLVFIDGAHSKEYVKSDTQNAMNLIKTEGGFIVWHDAHLYGVVQYLSELIKTNNGPVYFIKGTSLAFARVINGHFTEI